MVAPYQGGAARVVQLEHQVYTVQTVRTPVYHISQTHVMRVWREIRQHSLQQVNSTMKVRYANNHFRLILLETTLLLYHK